MTPQTAADVGRPPYDRGPVAALRRVAFLMERGREETRRVQAFRNAAATILPLGDDEVAARVEAGTLTELPGIGPSTAAVIEAAVRGRGAGAAGHARAASTPGRSPRRARPARGSCAATCTPTPTGPTAARRSRRWRSPRWSSATSTSCSPTTHRG